MGSLSTVLRGDKDVRRVMRDLRRLVEGETDVALRIIGTEGVRGAQENIRQQHGPNGEGWPALKWRNGRALQDTRRLYNSITYVAPLGSKVVTIGTNVIYSALHHFGGIITPKRAKMLFLPLSRKIARAYSGNARRDYPGAFIFRSRKGNLLLARRKEGSRRRGAALELLGLLRDSVRIPARPYLGISPATWTRIRKALEGKIASIAEGGAQ
jgi:phage gpG-like protein